MNPLFLLLPGGGRLGDVVISMDGRTSSNSKSPHFVRGSVWSLLSHGPKRLTRSPSSAILPLFGWEGSPTNTDYRKKVNRLSLGSVGQLRFFVVCRIWPLRCKPGSLTQEDHLHGRPLRHAGDQSAAPQGCHHPPLRPSGQHHQHSNTTAHSFMVTTLPSSLSTPSPL